MKVNELKTATFTVKCNVEFNLDSNEIYQIISKKLEDDENIDNQDVREFLLDFDNELPIQKDIMDYIKNLLCLTILK